MIWNPYKRIRELEADAEHLIELANEANDQARDAELMAFWKAQAIASLAKA